MTFGFLPVLKFGITRHDRPWTRLHSHAHSKDNPYRMRPTEVRAVSSFRFDSLLRAMCVEKAIKDMALTVLPDEDTWPHNSALGIPMAKSPSGEWLRRFGPQADLAFHRLAAATLVLPHLRFARGSFITAGLILQNGGGYSEHEVPA
jgi:hypothetical protein